MSNPPLTARFETDARGTTKILLSGSLNELSDIISIQIRSPRPDRSLCIDLNDIGSITSMGVRDFSRWSRMLKVTALNLSRCPKLFIDQLNMIPSFIPSHSSISSFYVPFRTKGRPEIASEEQSQLYVYPINFDLDRNGLVVLTHPKNVRDKKGNPMEFDMIPDSYFRFLNLYCPKKVSGGSAVGY